MSTQRGNVKKTGPPKHQNKGAWKNVYHDTSKQTKDIVATEVSGVCKRCKDVIDWRIKYKKYKPLSQAKTCAICKQKSVKHAYHIYCVACSDSSDRCAKCGENKKVVIEPSLTPSQQMFEERQLQFELEQLPERKRRSFIRLQQQGKLKPNDPTKSRSICDDDDDDQEDSEASLSDSEDDQMTGATEKRAVRFADHVSDVTCKPGAQQSDNQDRLVTDGKLANSDTEKLDSPKIPDEKVVNTGVQMLSNQEILDEKDNTGVQDLDDLSQLSLQAENCS